MTETYIWPQSEGPTSFTYDEFMKKDEEDKKKFFRNLKYWRHNKKLKTLTHIKFNYEVDLERITSSDGYLDWIMTVHGKRWMTAEALAEFITATKYLLENEIEIWGQL